MRSIFRQHYPEAFAVSYHAVIIGERTRQEHFAPLTTHNVCADDEISPDWAHGAIVDVNVSGSSNLLIIRQAPNEIIKQQGYHAAVDTSPTTMMEGRELRGSLR